MAFLFLRSDRVAARLDLGGRVGSTRVTISCQMCSRVRNRSRTIIVRRPPPAVRFERRGAWRCTHKPPFNVPHTLTTLRLHQARIEDRSRVMFRRNLSMRI